MLRPYPESLWLRPLPFRGAPCGVNPHNILTYRDTVGAAASGYCGWQGDVRCHMPREVHRQSINEGLEPRGDEYNSKDGIRVSEVVQRHKQA